MLFRQLGWREAERFFESERKVRQVFETNFYIAARKCLPYFLSSAEERK